MKIRHIVASTIALLAITLVPIASKAGDVRGAQEWQGLVPPRDIRSVELILRSDETSVIQVRGDGDTDLDCFLFDGNGNEVDRDDDNTDTCLLRVTPKWTGSFSVRIINNGRISNKARLLTN